MWEDFLRWWVEEQFGDAVRGVWWKGFWTGAGLVCWVWFLNRFISPWCDRWSDRWFPDPLTEEYNRAAIQAAEEAVKERLKSPGSAVFSVEEVTPIKGMTGFTVRGVVDSQDGFGALLRNTWTVDVYNGTEALNVRITPKN